MCHICAISEIAKKDRWPKPLEASKTDLHLLIPMIHDQYEHFHAVKQQIPTTPIPETLITLLRTLRELLNSLEDDREKWWTSPAKRELRKKLDLEGDQKKMSELQKINNAVRDRLGETQAKLGGFVRWTLGFNGGVYELENAWRVAGGV
ncbi:unnamed protein product [Zymoseptoria tritici ST99CH_1E4]|uniref:Uncharacterized protein n=1 Tax=Zymoseptoria tritici ST99CH_1E4 TaxID=1276532 RepID=A0A2H1GHC9_ZYMTR|nr:unnamed protein product [Zymoseptoria tritici ST99CH_1E4]